MGTDARHDVEKEITYDPHNSVVFDTGVGTDIYIVGGYTRDLLLRRGSRDRDYVVSGPMKGLITEVARETKGRVIELGREGLHRIVLADGVTLDFTPLRKDIETDLSYRDFTVNAIAWSPGTGWIDPEGGMDDLKGGVIRMIDAANLTQDPLRILRAYRFAGELSFKIEQTTRSALRMSASLISKASSERITSEFFEILNQKNPAGIVEMILEDGLLECLIITNYKDLERKVKALSDLYRRFGTHLKYSIRLEEIFSQGLARRGLLGLETLLEGLPKHLFALSAKIVRRILGVDRANRFLCSGHQGPLSRPTIFEMFEAAGEASRDFLLIRDLQTYVGDLAEYARIQKKGVLTAEEIRSAIGANPGPTLGEAIRAVKKAEFAGHIHSVEEALVFLKTWSH